MGGSAYSSSVFGSSIKSAASSSGGFFAYSKSATKVHEALDASKLNKAGLNIRESRDSDKHPTSNAVAVMFDVTGSMANVPRQFVSKLNALMGILVKKGYISDPQILFGAVGDAYSDDFPLQVGQFESGEEQVDVLTKIILEGGGGGQTTESYELAMYYLARHATMDCLEKRDKKGYLFLLGDELPYGKVSKDQVKRIIGDDIEKDIPLSDILNELRNKFEVFWIMPAGTSYYDNTAVNNALRHLFDQNFIKLNNIDDVSELIATTIGVCEGFDVKSIEADLMAAGSTTASAKNASTALSAFVANSSLARKTASVTGKIVKGSTKAKRL